MSNLEFAAIFAGCAALYFFVSAITQTLLDHDVGRDGPSGLLWPVVLPWLLGEAFTNWLTKERKSKLPEAKVHKP